VGITSSGGFAAHRASRAVCDDEGMTSAPPSTTGRLGAVAPTREEFRELAVGHRVIPVVRRLLADDETPIGVYRKLAGERPGTFLLESAENGRSWSRWSFVGAHSAAALTEVDRLTRLFQDILDMARIDAHGIVADRQWVTPADIVDAATAHVRHALERRTVRVDAPSDAEVEVDPRLASAALAHLLENAAQYSPSGEPITVKASAGAGGFEVSVTDNGPGLDPGELDHLFERFYRGRIARQSSFGTGMGLAITRGLLAAAGGRVWAENAPGAGARFTIAIPSATRAAAVVE